uniref:G_PROTEIN_RECEP_F1_2 domain-containing protein n=1 Tax=Macrostomum lignano TaxID=282301 RepID=A0A1I8FI49_9PLAT
ATGCSASPFANIWLSLDVLYCTASIWSLVVIAFDRFTATAFPIWYREQRKVRRFGCYSLFIWLLSGLICLPHLVGWNGKKFINPIEKFKKSLCDLFNEKNYVLYSATGSFILPLVVMIVLYSRIFVVLQRRARVLRQNQKKRLSIGRVAASQKHQQQQQQQQHDEGRPTVAINGEDASTLLHGSTTKDECIATESVCEEEETQLQQRQQHAKRKSIVQQKHQQQHGNPESHHHQHQQHIQRADQREQRATQRMLIIIVIFIVCWMPFTLMYLIRGLTSDSGSSDGERRHRLQDCRSGPGAGDLAGLREQRSQPHSVHHLQQGLPAGLQEADNVPVLRCTHAVSIKPATHASIFGQSPGWFPDDVKKCVMQ